jgi:Tfp pilus assembly protein PilO
LVEIDAEGVYSSQRPCSTDFLYTQGVARNISDRELEEASLQGQQESARRIGAHAGQIRSAYRQLQQQIKVRQRQEAEAESIQKIRDAIWRISKAEQIDDVLWTIHDSLRGLDIDFYGISINHVDKSRSIVRHYSFAGDEGGWTVSQDRVVIERVSNLVQADGPTYRVDLHREDLWEERDKIESGWGPPIRSVIDVPFEAGTFAVNSRSPEAFSERDQQFLVKMAVVLQEGFRRMSDLQDVQERSREAEQLTIKLQAALDREVVLSRIRDQIMEMRTLRDAPQHRDMLAALRELGVPVDGMSMQFPALLTVAGETTPCALMEQQQEGLLAALDADMRGGVFGPVQRTGCIQRGDRITVLAAS